MRERSGGGDIVILFFKDPAVFATSLYNSYNSSGHVWCGRSLLRAQLSGHFGVSSFREKWKNFQQFRRAQKHFGRVTRHSAGGNKEISLRKLSLEITDQLV